MHRSIPLVLIVLQAVLAQEDDEHRCPCRYKAQTSGEHLRSICRGVWDLD